MLDPVCVRLLVVSDENSKQDDHGDLPHEADGGQTHAYVGVLLRAQETAEVPHGEAVRMMLGSLIPAEMLQDTATQHLYMCASRGAWPTRRTRPSEGEQVRPARLHEAAHSLKECVMRLKQAC